MSLTRVQCLGSCLSWNDGRFTYKVWLLSLCRIQSSQQDMYVPVWCGGTGMKLNVLFIITAFMSGSLLTS